MALRSAVSALWPIALAGAVMLAGEFPAFAQSDTPAAQPTTQPATAKPAANKKTTAVKPEPAKPAATAAKPAQPKPVAAKPVAAKPVATKPAQPKANAKAIATARPGPNAKPALAPVIAQALRPQVPAADSTPAVVVPRPPTRSANSAPFVVASSTPAASAMDIATVKRAIELVRAHKQSEANALRKTLSDPVAQKLIEWAILRSDDPGADFARMAAFIAANPSWPGIVTLRRKAEAMLYQERPDAAAIRNYFAQARPLSAKGKFALARVLLAQGDRPGAEAMVREAWQFDAFSQDVEARAIEAFGDMLTRADHKARMDRRLYSADDAEAGLRIANRLGGQEPAIAKARIAVLKHAGNAKALLDAVPPDARKDVGYLFSRAHFLRKGDHIAEATAVILSAPNSIPAYHDLDEWWSERRQLVRKLLDQNDFKNAYQVARNATPPARDNYRADQQFTAGWIALRYLNDPASAYGHFARVAEGNDNPITLARGAYWQGRAAEAMKKTQEARAHYTEAARHPTAYYGQIARAKLGLNEMGLAGPPAFSASERARLAQLEIVRAVELLYAIDARELISPMMADLGDKADDAAALLTLADIAAKHDDPRAMMLVGKLALGRGVAVEHAAFPTIGVPSYKPIGPEVDPAVVFSIIRQESWFNQQTVSRAKAMGLMQVTPPAARHLAAKYKVAFEPNRLLTDKIYNLQMGSAELGELLRDFRGSYIMTFVGYNAGRGRLREWVGKYGDPRDPKVDPIDWVERIPIAETRNYVQRVMENLQVYRVRFGGDQRLLIEADLRRGATAN